MVRDPGKTLGETQQSRKENYCMRNLSIGLPASVVLLGFVTWSFAQLTTTTLTMGQVMTGQELVETGVAKLTPAQRRALDRWLNTYTTRVLRIAGGTGSQSCTPAIETQVSGEFEGWEGETIFRLDNGQIWEQSSYSYTYHYAYRPEVIIYSSGGGCKMKVEDVDETISVRRIR